MLHQIIEIQSEDQHISLTRGFLVICREHEEIARVSLDDIGVLLLSSQRISLTKNIITELSNRGTILILCGKSYIPESIIVPVVGNYLFTEIFKHQMDASLPLRKNVWKEVVAQKIINQSKVLEYYKRSETAKLLQNISKQVKSGDSDNREGYAARVYWSSLFGESFTRDQDAEGINSLLNYAYTILRSAMIRAIISTGLQPALGVHHSNKLNPFCLADDFMEIYRPIADLLVRLIIEEQEPIINPHTKKILTTLLWVQVQTTQGKSPVFQSMNYLCSSYAKLVQKKIDHFSIPIWEGKYERISDFK